jgi:hypothetical protein
MARSDPAVNDTRFVPADRFGPADLHAAFKQAFSDYVAGPFAFTLDQWDSVLARWVIDLAASRVAVRDGRIIAFAYTSRRPEIGRWRLGAMGRCPRRGARAPHRRCWTTSSRVQPPRASRRWSSNASSRTSARSGSIAGAASRSCTR